ncbi:MAG: hypothetical protein CVU39_23945 [Chloroflexi bacterium HGW-Chloroflexi-10]|nr:MAG: hypothetical protein CVU39_23945 [Chloroflexi bacterium HGW-Chloroflexi-10]
MTNDPETNQKIKEAIAIAKQGDKNSARNMIIEILEKDATNENALLAYAFVAPNTAEAEEVLEEVLRLNPDNVTALKQLSKLRKDDLFTPTASTVPLEKSASPFTSESYTQAEEKTDWQTTTPQQPVSLPCIRCGKPVYDGSNHCDSCKAELNQGKRALDASLGVENTVELEKKIERLIAIQKDQQQELKKISRAAQLFFWMTIVSIVLGIISFCIGIASSASLLQMLNNLPQ